MSGFHANPVRFLSGAPAWRAVAWTCVLAVLALPLLTVSLVLLPWIPLVAWVVDRLGRAGATWMGAEVPDREVNRWFDWQQFVLLLVHVLLSLVAFVVVVALGCAAVLSAVIPLHFLRTPYVAINFGPWETAWPPAVFTVSWALALLFAVLLVYFSWLLAGASVFATVASNKPSQEEIEHLEHSRTVLIDAFTGERRRIERELHDGVQQYLTALQMNVAAAQLSARQLPSDGAGEASLGLDRSLEQAKSNAARAMESLRSTIRGIYPQVLRDNGLVEALRELVAHSGIDGTVRAPETVAPRMGETPALLLYHCAAEGVTNAVRHGSAGRVLVEVTFPGRTVVLTVDDDGAVNGPGTVAADGGTGIAGLRERAAALGGTVELGESPALTGARLRMELTT